MITLLNSDPEHERIIVNSCWDLIQRYYTQPPVMPLSMDVRNMIEDQCGLENIAPIGMQTWDKEELINLLKNPGQK